MKTGIVDVGGGLRGSYGCGVFDYCMDKGISFDVCVGVSAGSGNIASFLAGQRGRSLRFYVDYAFRKEYMSFRNLVQKGAYLDVQYIYGTLTDQGGEDPLDYDALARNPSQMIVVASDAVSGKSRYFTKEDLKRNDYGIMKGSSSIPVVCKPFPVGDRLYYDGAISDAIPLGQAFGRGCEKVVLVLTRPKGMSISGKRETRLSRFIRYRYPETAKNLCLRAKRYNEGVARARELEKKGNVLIVAPKSIEGMKTLTRDKKQIMDLYERGYADAAAINRFVSPR